MDRATKEALDKIIQLEEEFKRKPRKLPPEEEAERASFQDVKPVAEIFSDSNAAQGWIDALAGAIKRDLLEPNGIKYGDGFRIGMAVSGFYPLRDKEAGSTWPAERLVWVDATQPPLWAASTLAHELVHTGQPAGMTNDEAHNEQFGDALTRIGLLAPWTASRPGPVFTEWFKHHAPQPEDFAH